MPFQGHVLTSLVEATWSLLVCGPHFNLNIDNKKLIYTTESVPRWVISSYLLPLWDVYFDKNAIFSCLAGFNHMFIVSKCKSTCFVASCSVSVSTILFFMLEKHATVYTNKGFVH